MKVLNYIDRNQVGPTIKSSMLVRCTTLRKWSRMELGPQLLSYRPRQTSVLVLSMYLITKYQVWSKCSELYRQLFFDQTQQDISTSQYWEIVHDKWFPLDYRLPMNFFRILLFYMVSCTQSSEAVYLFDDSNLLPFVHFSGFANNLQDNSYQ